MWYANDTLTQIMTAVSIGIEEAVFQPLCTLLQNQPNPFIQKTTIEFRIGASQNAVPLQLQIYDLAGRVVHNIPIPNPKPQITKIVWDGTDLWGKKLAKGIYFYQLKGVEKTDTQKMILLR